MSEEKKNPFEFKPDYSKPVGPPMEEQHFLRGSTPMHKAAALARNHYDTEDVPKAVQMIEKLLAAGATLVDEYGKCRRDQYGDSTLHLAAMATGRNGVAVIKALVDALPTTGPYTKEQLVSARCKNFGNTALHWATLNGNVESCEFLLNAGSRPDRKNRLKQTVLDYAVKYEQPKLKVKYEGLLAK